MNFNIKTILKIFIFAFIGFLILFLLYQNQNEAYQLECATKGVPSEECNYLNKIYNDFASVKMIWMFAVMFIFMVSNVFRALRWNQLMESIDLKPRLINSLGATMIGYFANLGLPRIGEFVKVGVISKYDNLPADKVMGTIIIDRIMDVICLLLFIVIGLVLSFDIFKDYFAENFQMSTTQIMTGFLTVALVGLSCLYFLYRFVFLQINEDSPAFLQKIKKMIFGFAEGIQSVFKLDKPVLFILYSLGIWICYYLMTYLCFFSFEPTSHLGPTAGLVVFIFGTLGMVFPSPGGMGSYQYLVSQALLIYGISSIEAFSFSNIIYVAIALICNVLFGLLFLIYLPIYNNRSK